MRLNIEDLDLDARRAPIRSEGGDAALKPLNPICAWPVPCAS